MNGRILVITSALMEKKKGTYASIDVLAEAKAITVPAIVNRIIEARAAGEFDLACTLSLDMVVCRIRTVREGYARERQKALKRGDIGLATTIETECRGCRPEEEGGAP